jgi:hypothetical protein
MNEGRLRDLLREAPVPGADDAERRGLAVMTRALAEREPRRRPALPRLAIALTAATLIAALLLTPAGADVRDWIDDVLTAGVRDAEPALTEVPGGGRLLVASSEGSWVVQSDGSRRLIGRYGNATWSPHGLFVATTSGRTLSAVEPDGTAHWSLSARAPVYDPLWSPSGFRIAYRAGATLRVVAGDGTGDAPLDRGVGPVPAVWLPQGPHLLSYLDHRGALRIINTDTGEAVGSTMAPAGTTAIGWAPDGSRLLEATRHALLLREVRVGKVADDMSFGPVRRVPLPSGATVRDASFSSRSEVIAALLRLPARGERPPRSALVLIDPAELSLRPLFTTPGRLRDLLWSPNGRRILIPWPDADQWLFIPVGGAGRVRAIAGIAAEFAPGRPGNARFPRIDGWCCHAGIRAP